MEMMLWNIGLSAIVALMGWILKNKFEELTKLGNLLNKTREEIAREHVTRNEVSRDLEKVMMRFESCVIRLETKLDDMRKDMITDLRANNGKKE